MPVRKFRSVAEMSEPLWRKAGDPELFLAIRYRSALAERTVGHRFPPGVDRHRGIEEAKALRGEWETENVRRYQRTRVERAEQAATPDP